MTDSEYSVFFSCRAKVFRGKKVLGDYDIRVEQVLHCFYGPVMIERFRTSAIKTSSSPYLSKSKDVINFI